MVAPCVAERRVDVLDDLFGALKERQRLTRSQADLERMIAVLRKLAAALPEPPEPPEPNAG